MTTPLGYHKLDDRLWRAATWSTPIAIQGVLGVTLVAMWLLGKVGTQHGSRSEERITFLVAMAIAVVVSLAVAAILWRRTSSITRGVGLGVAGSAAGVLIGGSVYAFWPL